MQSGTKISYNGTSIHIEIDLTREYRDDESITGLVKDILDLVHKYKVDNVNRTFINGYQSDRSCDQRDR